MGLCWTSYFALLVTLCAVYGLALVSAEETNCFNATTKGSTYVGNLNVSEDGFRCSNWNASWINGKYRAWGPGNACRNKDGGSDRPWCYLDDPRTNTRWDYCLLPNCGKKTFDCYNAKDKGATYFGNVSITEKGLVCQRWDVDTPHKRNEIYPRHKHSYCRNSLGDSIRPWCYTTSPSVRWQYCGINKCIVKKCERKTRLHKCDDDCTGILPPISESLKLNRSSPPDVGLVVDTTGSMKKTLRVIQEGLNDLVRLDSEWRYVLVPVNDPIVGPVTISNNSTYVRGIIRDTLKARGGGNCPEMILTGIKTAAKNLRPGSVMYVFTDASARDRRKLDKVKRMIRRKNIQVNFILVGNLCGDEEDSKREYKELAGKYGKVITVPPGFTSLETAMIFIFRTTSFPISEARALNLRKFDEFMSTCTCKYDYHSWYEEC